MSWTYLGTAKGDSTGDTTTVATGTTLDISVGDLLVVQVRWDGATTTVSSIESGSGENTCTLESVQQNSVEVFCQVAAYVVADTADATATVTATLGASRTYKYIQVLLFEPSAGTVTKDVGPAYNQRTDDFASSGNVTTDGTDEVVVGMCSTWDTQTIYNSNWDIGGAAADAIIEETAQYHHAAYSILSSTFTNENSIAEYGGSDDSIAFILGFKLEDVIAPATLTPTGTLHAPTFSAPNTTVYPSALSGEGTIETPILGNIALIQPATLSAQGTLEIPIIGQIEPDTLIGEGTLFGTVTTHIGIDILPDAFEAEGTISDPTYTYDYTIDDVTAISGEGTLHIPTITGQDILVNITVTPDPLGAEGTLNAPSVIDEYGALIKPSLLNGYGTIEVFAPSGGLRLEPVALGAEGTIHAPVLPNNAVFPATLSGLGYLFPSVINDGYPSTGARRRRMWWVMNKQKRRGHFAKR